MSERVILDDIPVSFDLDALAQRLHLDEGSDDYHTFQGLLQEARELARPKALYTLAFIDDRGEDWVTIEGVTFRSRVLSVNLMQAHRVFAQVATCGTELDAWSQGLSDFLWRYWAEAIKEAALRIALRAAREDQDGRFRPGKTASMAPGSLPDWPIEEQQRLFALLGDVEGSVGVRLTPSMLMVPNKSSSALRFPTEADFESCMLCPREACPGRRAPYDAVLYEQRYAER